MAGPLWCDRVMETTTTTGTGTLTLAGAVTGYQTWACVGNGNTAYYCVYAVDAVGTPTGAWEVGVGTYTASGTTLARTTVLATSNGDTNAVNFAAGTKRVILAAAATHLATIPVANGGTGLTALGSALQVLRVNAGGNALEYAAASSGLTVGSTAIASGTSGRLLYDNGGTLGETAAITYAASGTHLTATAASATDVPFAVKFGSASPTANAIEIRDSSGNVRGGWGPQSTINDSLAVFFRPGGGRYYYMGTYEAAGSWKWARSDSSATLEFLPDSTGGIRFNGFSLPYFSGGTANYLYIHSRGDGGTSTLNLNARNDNSSGVGGTVNCWTKTSQTANALAVLAPGGGSTLWAIAPSGATLCASLADSAAPNSSLYYSTTAGKLVWKDSGGVVNNLY